MVASHLAAKVQSLAASLSRRAFGHADWVGLAAVIAVVLVAATQGPPPALAIDEEPRLGSLDLACQNNAFSGTISVTSSGPADSVAEVEVYFSFSSGSGPWTRGGMAAWAPAIVGQGSSVTIPFGPLSYESAPAGTSSVRVEAVLIGSSGGGGTEELDSQVSSACPLGGNQGGDGGGQEQEGAEGQVTIVSFLASCTGTSIEGSMIVDSVAPLSGTTEVRVVVSYLELTLHWIRVDPAGGGGRVTSLVPGTRAHIAFSVPLRGIPADAGIVRAEADIARNAGQANADTETIWTQSTNCPSADVQSAITGPAYTVVLGDTLGEIANRWSVTPDALLAANSLPRTTRLFIGQQLQIPRVEPTATATPTDVPTATPTVVPPRPSFTGSSGTGSTAPAPPGAGAQAGTQPTATPTATPTTEPSATPTTEPSATPTATATTVPPEETPAIGGAAPITDELGDEPPPSGSALPSQSMVLIALVGVMSIVGLGAVGFFLVRRRSGAPSPSGGRSRARRRGGEPPVPAQAVEAAAAAAQPAPEAATLQAAQALAAQASTEAPAETEPEEESDDGSEDENLVLDGADVRNVFAADVHRSALMEEIARSTSLPSSDELLNDAEDLAEELRRRLTG